ncbi:MAG: hypothetical protein HEQ20_18940 [Aphanizomenon flos-aquae KM1D3_PB]|nr:hypothetical protein [Aphanizomenon flos-aquae]QSV72447.1 MAG: hypothetical protein HEQ20_18940 [Aphanizomenon flos-aquae KM1D3_PB]
MSVEPITTDHVRLSNWTRIFTVIASEGKRSQPIYSHCERREAIATYL